MDPMYVFDDEPPHMRGCDACQDMTGGAKCNCREIIDTWEKVIIVATIIRDKELINDLGIGAGVDEALKNALYNIEKNGW